MNPAYLEILNYIWRIIDAWWWLILPFFLEKHFAYFWLFWRTELWFQRIFKPVMIEVRLPKEMLKPLKAMEVVMTSIHGAVYNPPDWWEAYIDGQPQTGVSFDIVSVGGQIHFYIRFHADYRDQIEAAIWGQYPLAEIIEVPDYTKQVPMDIPNKEWDMFGWDYKLEKASQIPIKTYEKFEHPGEKDEERVDPLGTLLESLSKIKPGEQLWIQIRTSPQGEASAEKFYKAGEELRDKMARRQVKPKQKSILREILDFIMYGAKGAEEEKKEVFPPEMRLTPGEKDSLMEVEKKISKPIFMVGIRAIYMGKRDVWFKPNFRLVLNYFNNFASPDMNSLVLWSATLTRVKKSAFLPMNWIQARRAYLKTRKLYRCYRDRLNYKSPLFGGDQGRFILNVEELATLYHFPAFVTSPVPGLNRVESKQTIPPDLPM
jgi:hypothetical protein